MPKAVISASVNLDVASQIAAEARDKGWSVSEIVNRALKAYVEGRSALTSERQAVKPERRQPVVK